MIHWRSFAGLCGLCLLAGLSLDVHAQLPMGGVTVVTAGCSPASHSYTTAFPATENPIAQGCQWQGGAQSPALDWTNIQTTPAFAFGTEAATHANLDDSTAMLLGTWGAPQEIWGVVVAPTAANTDKELELRTRLTMASHSITGYEWQMTSFQSTTSGCDIGLQRWNGPINNFTAVTCTHLLTGAGVCLHTSDVVRATSIGNTHDLYINGVHAENCSDSTDTTGSPGIGTFIGSGAGLSNDFGFSSITATDTPFAFVQSASHDVSTSGTTVAATMGANTTTGDIIWCTAYWAATSRTGSVADTANGTYTASAGGPVNGASGLSTYRAETFWKVNITGATTPAITLTLSGSAASIDRAISCHEARGPTSVDKDITMKSGSGATGTSTTSGTLTNAHEYAAGSCVYANAYISPPNSPWNQDESTNWGGNITGDTVTTATTAVQFSANQNTSGNYLCGLTTFK